MKKINNEVHYILNEKETEFHNTTVEHLYTWEGASVFNLIDINYISENLESKLRKITDSNSLMNVLGQFLNREL